jgi:hypothetical protein
MALWLKVSRRSGEDTDIDAKIQIYCDQLMAWPERMALACIAEHPKRSAWWPAWKELEDLRAEFDARQREGQRMLPNPGQPETFAQRATRLKIHRRLGEIGVQRWRVVMDRQRTLADSEVFTALDRIEAGRPAFAESGQ